MQEYQKEAMFLLSGWKITTKVSCEILAFEGEGVGRAVLIAGMKVIAQIFIVEEIIKVNTLEGYGVQILLDERLISIIKEEP